MLEAGGEREERAMAEASLKCEILLLAWCATIRVWA